MIVPPVRIRLNHETFGRLVAGELRPLVLHLPRPVRPGATIHFVDSEGIGWSGDLAPKHVVKIIVQKVIPAKGACVELIYRFAPSVK